MGFSTVITYRDYAVKRFTRMTLRHEKSDTRAGNNLNVLRIKERQLATLEIPRHDLFRVYLPANVSV